MCWTDFRIATSSRMMMTNVARSQRSDIELQWAQRNLSMQSVGCSQTGVAARLGRPENRINENRHRHNASAGACQSDAWACANSLSRGPPSACIHWTGVSTARRGDWSDVPPDSSKRRSRRCRSLCEKFPNSRRCLLGWSCFASFSNDCSSTTFQRSTKD
jgi:hypothetical protein